MSDEREDWAVMDARALFDTDAASVLEACGRRRPSDRYLRKAWGEQSAVLVRWYGWDGEKYTEEEIVEVIP